ncbi:hypothetical protein KAW64_03335 [bacterium]|nr:hypothetical protein [bacterium]
MRKYLAVVAILSLAASAGATELTVRLGQGGFRDDRASDGQLGGGQICLDVTLNDLPFTVSIGHEYYTKSPDPTQSYEISSIVMGTVCYVMPLAEKWPTDLHLGGSVGGLRIPQGEKAVALQAIARIRTKAFWKLGIYAEGKYIYSKGELIDFSEVALLIGISFSLHL